MVAIRLRVGTGAVRARSRGRLGTPSKLAQLRAWLRSAHSQRGTVYVDDAEHLLRLQLLVDVQRGSRHARVLNGAHRDSKRAAGRRPGQGWGEHARRRQEGLGG